MNQLTPINPATNVEAYRASTEAASICKDIVVKTATSIQGRKYVGVEGWQAIALAHGCAAGSRDVERVEGGVRAVGEIRRMSDGAVIATAEGFVGEDEPTWYGGDNGRGRMLPKRPDYAIRAMAQTRAISRACRSAFAHVVVMMNAGLATTPAEEVPAGGFDDTPHDPQTGEVIEGHVEPQARQKLDGPHTSKTALRKAVHDIIAKVRAADTVEAIEGIKTAEKRTINQALRDWPALITGDPNIPEDVGLRGVIERRRAELSEPEDGQFSMLIASMKQCETVMSLTNWMAANEAIIGELDGAESRRFQLAYDLHESAIKTMDSVQ